MHVLQRFVLPWTERVLANEPQEAKEEPFDGLPNNGALDEILLEDPGDATPWEVMARLMPALVKPPETPVSKPT